MELKKVFISHNMRNLSEEAVKNIRDRAIEHIRSISLEDDQKSFYFFDNYYHKEISDEEKMMNDDNPLFFLSHSIKQLGESDYVYFIPGFSDNRGCQVERLIAELYGIPIIE